MMITLTLENMNHRGKDEDMDWLQRGLVDKMRQLTVDIILHSMQVYLFSLSSVAG